MGAGLEGEPPLPKENSPFNAPVKAPVFCELEGWPGCCGGGLGEDILLSSVAEIDLACKF